MEKLFKLGAGAAIAVALYNLLHKERFGEESTEAFDDTVGMGDHLPTLSPATAGLQPQEQR